MRWTNRLRCSRAGGVADNRAGCGGGRLKRACGIGAQAVSDGLSITWLPHIIAADALHSGQLVELLPEYAITYAPLYLYYPSRRGHSNVFKLIVDALKLKAV